MKTVIVTGSAGLVGSEAVRQFAALGYRVVGIDNFGREEYFGAAGSVEASASRLATIKGYEHYEFDISDAGAWTVFERHEDDVAAVIHCAAQPSHDWAASNPSRDFQVNAYGTLNILEAVQKYNHRAAFVFCSTNKVYGDFPNGLEYKETDTRFSPTGVSSVFSAGFQEIIPIDQCTHSLFGASKLAADVMVQEYGRYFGMNTVCFRGGCLTGPGHAGVPQHGFLSYLVKCAVTGTPYQIIGYGGKQVRDNIHASDLVLAFVEYVNNPTPGAVYNIGGGLERSVSVLEAISLVERITGKRMQVSHVEEPRIGDHKWWVSDTRKFEAAYPNWSQRYSLEDTVREIVEAHSTREAA